MSMTMQKATSLLEKLKSSEVNDATSLQLLCTAAECVCNSRRPVFWSISAVIFPNAVARSFLSNLLSFTFRADSYRTAPSLG
jgi:hypothetical protein